MRALILAALVSFGLGIGMGDTAAARPYQTPAYNYYHNNWMSD